MGIYTEALRTETNSDSKPRNTATISIGKTEFKAYALPLTGMDMDWIARKHKGFLENPSMEGMADLLIRKVHDDASGEKAFDIKDKPHLLRMPLSWFQSVVADLLPDADVDLSEEAIEDAEKN